MSKRKWDQQGPEAALDESPASKVSKVDDGKTATEAAAAAAAIAAKIAAQFSGPGEEGLGKEPHDGEYTKDLDINDVRNLGGLVLY